MIITGKKFSKPKLSRVINGDDIIDDGVETIEKFRLDHQLVKKYPDYNRSTLQTFIKSGYVTVNGAEVKKPNTKILEEDQIELNLPDEYTNNDLKNTAIENMRPETIFENDDVLVVTKPEGLLSMAKGEICNEPTLEDYGLLVHRLDRDTSGVVILAKNPDTQTYLRKQFQDRKAHKTYLAIVEGHPKMNQAMIDLPIARNPKHPTTFMVDANGRASQTLYTVLDTKQIKNGGKTRTLSLVELKPTTGRTHQLRVHMQYIGNPILGDRVYGNNQNDAEPRLFLHAKELEITIPDGGKNIRKTFTSNNPHLFDKYFKVK